MHTRRHALLVDDVAAHERDVVEAVLVVAEGHHLKGAMLGGQPARPTTSTSRLSGKTTRSPGTPRKIGSESDDRRCGHVFGVILHGSLRVGEWSRARPTKLCTGASARGFHARTPTADRRCPPYNAAYGDRFTALAEEPLTELDLLAQRLHDEGVEARHVECSAW